MLFNFHTSIAFGGLQLIGHIAGGARVQKSTLFKYTLPSPPIVRASTA
jgi:hypothetical protein